MALTMMELPKAMRKCNVGAEQEDMILDSLKSMGRGMDVDFHLPEDKITNHEITSRVAASVKDWTKQDWWRFGKDIGGLMQGALIKFYPQKYSVDGGLLK